MDFDSPASLIAALRAGSPDAFAAVYRSERSPLYGFLLRLSADESIAADLFQNVWLKLARHCARLREDTNIRAWLFTVGRHEYVSYRRAQALDLSRVLALGREPTPGPASADPKLGELRAALTRLHDRDRELLLMTSVDGLDHAEAARALGVGGAALRQRLRRARQRLAAALLDEAAGVAEAGVTRAPATEPAKGSER